MSPGTFDWSQEKEILSFWLLLSAGENRSSG
jgi:hypothetical protein